MTNASHLAAEIDAFAGIVDGLRGIADRSDPGRRSELVALRRQMAERIARMRDIGLQEFTDPVLADDFRSRLSRVLNLMALHQAKWPAVLIDDDGDDYRRSAHQLAHANRAFIDWSRAALTRLG